jgi:superfamily II DNA or RNA helicase/HKD family nuclease
MNYEDIQNGLQTAFVNKENASNVIYRPQFISNDHTQGKKVLSTIESELSKCEEFSISVAFITMSGIIPLLPIFKELEAKNIKGKILTTDYLAFSEPKALDKLSEFHNISLKMYLVPDTNIGFHTKGYIFKEKEIYKILVGSSNLTSKALTINKEWNTKLVSSKDGEYIQEILSEFNQLWNSDNTYEYNLFIGAYRKHYEEEKKKKSIPQISYKPLKPNSMQKNFIHNLNEILNNGKHRALLISATGTGKTYASAFALKDIHAKKVLFLVHREQIAKQALHTYKNVFKNERTYGLLSGTSRDINVDFLFSTMQMMSKEEIYTQFKSDTFDTIVVDEAHRVGAKSYQNIINYFKPNLLLGMSASPERSDEFDVYAQFDHNIAYEIRLQQALEENLLCPFHYFGITDFTMDGKETDYEDFNYLTSNQRVDYILEQAKFYGYSGNRVKGLMFVSSKKEAIELSQRFNLRGLRTIALSGDDSQSQREDAIDRLVSDTRTDYLEYILTVDIFNEGVDIPEINQVILLRPTQSPIVFVQQLGRGLRKAQDKEFVVILDFIGNYQNNFMIPIALSGDCSYNKDNIRRYVLEGERVIPGASTIHFDEISKKKIFASIDATNFNNIRLIKENYLELKYKLGHIPSLLDFEIYGQIDPQRIFDTSKSYYAFLKKYEKEYTIRLNQMEEEFINFVSMKLANGKRKDELIIIDELIQNHKIKSMNTNIKNILTNEFQTGSSKNTFKQCIFINEDYTISQSFKKCLENNDFKTTLIELIEYGLYKNETNYKHTYNDTNFVLYKKYTYEDACRLLNWSHNEVPLNIGGYKYDKETKTFPVFINYDKAQDIQNTIKYEDHFINESQLIAISKSGRTRKSEDVQNFLYAQERGIQVHLFVRKNKNDEGSKEFYYLGLMSTDESKARQFIMPNTEKTAVELLWNLNTPIREDIYEYITKG